MGLINWIFDIYQHGRIDDAEREAARASAEVRALRLSTSSDAKGNQDRALGELALATKALQRMLVLKGVCTTDELAKMLREIDLEDGVADGRAPIG
jgi:hypothetical protein